MMKSIMITVGDQERVRHSPVKVFDAGREDVTWPSSPNVEITPMAKTMILGSVVLFRVKIPNTTVDIGEIEATVTACESPSLLVIEGRSNMAELMARFDLRDANNGQETDVKYYFEAEIRKRLIRCIAEPAIRAALNVQLPDIVKAYIGNVSAHIDQANGSA